ncbi:MAG: hypothetical protein P8H24_06840 [Methylophilaceae bacterium]|nr:hypothetical protein [Methylophilaceae bacterium]
MLGKVGFDVLYPSKASKQDADVKDNNRSCVIKVTSRYGAVLLTGDIEKRAEQVLLARQASRLKSGVLIAPHHGSKTSSSKALIDAVAAKYVVFTVGYLNRFKHPQPIVVSRYLEVGATTYRSDYDGAILIDFTEQNPMHVNRWRRSHAKYWHDQFYQD